MSEPSKESSAASVVHETLDAIQGDLYLREIGQIDEPTMLRGLRESLTILRDQLREQAASPAGGVVVPRDETQGGNAAQVHVSTLNRHLRAKDAAVGEGDERPYLTGTALVPFDPLYAALNGELPALRDALAEMEVYMYETWANDDRLTKDAAQRFVRIADIFGWDMPWVDEMRAWSK